MIKTISFLFITSGFLFSTCAFNKKQISCEQFKKGLFELHSEVNNSISLIDRNDSIQTETDLSTGHIVKTRIKWTSNCDYELLYISQLNNSEDSIGFSMQSKPLKTTIVQTHKDYYIFKSTMEGADFVFVDTLKVVK